MSVLLFGTAENNEKWTGEWYFAKNKAKRKRFSYKKVSQSAPRDMINYVSFIRPPSEGGHSGRGRGRRGRGRGRGRGHNRSNADTVVVGNDTGSDDGVNKLPHDDVTAEQEKVSDPTNTTGEENMNSSEPTNEVATSLESKVSSESKETLETQDTTYDDSTQRERSSSNVSDSSAHAEDDSSTPVEIPPRHPLFGLWEGSFMVGDQKGVEEEVHESFILYAFHSDSPQLEGALDSGIDPSSALANLPPCPRWTVSFVRALHEDGGRHPAKVIEKANATETACPMETGDTGSTSTNQHTNGTGSSTHTGVEKAANEEDDDEHTAEVDSGDVPGLVPPSEEVMLIGFGKNIYGRFSIAGAYNPAAGTLRCEKKYMLSKLGGRPRKSSISPLSTRHDGSDEAVRMSTRHRYPPTPMDAWHEDPVPTPASAAVLSNGTPVDESFSPRPLQKRRRTSLGASTSAEEAAMTSSIGFTPSYMKSIQQDQLSDAYSDDIQDDYRHAFYDEDTGDVYEGGWENGLRHGKGIALFPDGTMYEGTWLNGKKHGFGQLMDSNRQVIFSGEWYEGKFSGKGEYIYLSTGDVYTGEWKEGARHGKGEYVRGQDGIRYVGDWRDNMRHGRGVLTWPDGSFYEGEFDRDAKHGRGELHLSNGFYYSGYWDMNYMEGRGVCVFPDGQEYQGVFKRGLKEGRGSIRFSEGAVYEGRFREDAMDGQGTLKIHKTVPGPVPGEVLIPIEIQADIRRIHHRAGFGSDSH
mmetsp:Transcript_14674/g.22141  ORF Transcript_14674/g.22141 Transcript_14674/m.22141 type:complete len:748 (+) Transcript_14674:55-2298(+)